MEYIHVLTRQRTKDSLRTIVQFVFPLEYFAFVFYLITKDFLEIRDFIFKYFSLSLLWFFRFLDFINFCKKFQQFFFYLSTE